jgi:hypothetical protein
MKNWLRSLMRDLLQPVTMTDWWMARFILFCIGMFGVSCVGALAGAQLAGAVGEQFGWHAGGIICILTLAWKFGHGRVLNRVFPMETDKERGDRFRRL